MLQQQILNTIKYFDFQDLPLTAVEVWQFLIADKDLLVSNISRNFDINSDSDTNNIYHQKFALSLIYQELQSLVSSGQLKQSLGFFCLPQSTEKINRRLVNYRHGLKREKLIKRYIKFVRYLPFIRGVALGGSQAFGLNKPSSDIDLLIYTDHRFMFLARTILMFYFQIFGVRRHGLKIANRFCLNHYISIIREVDVEKNLYKAVEYSRLRYLVYGQSIQAFQVVNKKWINFFLPNLNFDYLYFDNQSTWQGVIEFLLNNKLGAIIEKHLAKWQIKRIKQGEYIFVKEDELSFHPESKHEDLLKKFFIN